MKLLHAASVLAAALSLAACGGNSATENAVEPSTLNQDALEATENLTVTDTPLGNEALDGNALDAPAANLDAGNDTLSNDTGGNAL